MITLEKMKQKKKTLSVLKKILIGTIVVFCITLVLYFFIMNLRYGGYNPKPVDIYFYINVGVPFSLLILTGVIFVILRLFTAKYISHYFHYIKNTFFNNTKVKREDIIKLLRIQDENLRRLGFNYTVKEFTFNDFIHAFKNLEKKQKIKKKMILLGIDDVLKGDWKPMK